MIWPETGQSDEDLAENKPVKNQDSNYNVFGEGNG